MNDPEDRYADPIDRAVVEQQRLLDEQLRLAKERATPGLAALGTCHNCSEPLEQGARFCDEDCRDDYQHRTTRRLINRG